MNLINETNDAPVTVDVVLQVKPNCSEEFEQILTEMIAAAKMFEGHLGVNVFRSSDPVNLEYRLVFKFDRLSHFRQWESSEVRLGYLSRINRLTIDSGQFQILTGLESWFTLSTRGAIVPPPRYKIFILTWVTIFILINLINQLLVPYLTVLPQPLPTLIVSGLMVFTMTYIIMPRITKLFRTWLYPNP
jgi:uncharacterized protein